MESWPAQHSIWRTKIQMKWPEEICGLYRDTARDLGRAFGTTLALDNKFTAWEALPIWPMLISEEYMDLLRTLQPSALILLDHYSSYLEDWKATGTLKAGLQVYVLLF
jgi:hypothetical protein